ncbi:hypothetical protein AKJ39_01805 [candidate division MSBL1 archaeon SCGC-AAA259J03]|uniref:Uncharacterized protein n=1 Tax=candidate division MSBL1 archaeon SCGC-AAA259J03 TaxID=1698269 RepID=A0A656YX89_9EURY|nr:hypothetical protein AKJ39_01805 [candidate division MSBL1 archaeon SCGC-AAA259J03]
MVRLECDEEKFTPPIKEKKGKSSRIIELERKFKKTKRKARPNHKRPNPILANHTGQNLLL